MLEPGADVREHLRLVRPPVAFDFAALRDGPQEPVVLEASGGALRLKGPMVNAPEQGCLIFLGPPALAGVDAEALRQRRDPTRPDGEPEPGDAGSGVAPLAPGSGYPVRVLVAEDNPENQELARRILERAGAMVDVAADGHAAVLMASRTRYDLILMDLQMPALDGCEAAAAIRATEHAADQEPVPIVAFTAHAAEGVRERCLRAGMNDHIAKPIATRELVDTVNRWADRRPVVLVVDDSPQVRRIVSLRLRDRYRVVQAANGREALEQFGRQAVSVVMLDMHMPVMDGYSTAAAIRRREDGREVPIVAVTGDESAESWDRASAAGCTLQLVKPVRLTTLASIVETAINQHPAAGTPLASSREPAASAGSRVRLDIDPLVADLVPAYVREKRSQVPELRRLIEGHDMEGVKRIAHDLKGTGSAYGIPDVTRLGRELETASRQRDEGAAVDLVGELDALLSRVQQQLGG